MKKTKLQHYGSGGCILRLILLLEKLEVLKRQAFRVPLDGFIEMYESLEERDS